jgi:DUF4097 and DUF4098 domain-containing protein YvlB
MNEEKVQMRFKLTDISQYVIGGLTIVLLMALQNSDARSQELRREGRRYIAEIHESFRVSNTGTLRIYDIRGDVEIIAWDQNSVDVIEYKRMDVYSEDEAREALRRSQSSYEQRDSEIEIRGDHSHRDWIESHFEIKIPEGFSVDVETSGGDLSVEKLSGEVRLKTSGGEIRLTDIEGDVDAKTSGGDIIVINSTSRVGLKTSGGRLELENIGGPIIARTSGGNIRLSKSDDRVDLHTSGGDIEIRDAGGEVKAHTSGGDIDVDNSQGAVEVTTSGGDIQLREVGGSLEASTSGGDIQGRTIAGRAEVFTSGGSIKLEGVDGGVRAKTAGGDIIVEITLKDFRKDHRIDLRTAGGEITLSIPADLPATIRAEIEITDRWEDYNIYSDFPLTSTEENDPERSSRGRRRRSRSRRFIRSEGEVNGGGDLIELFTTNGDIHINKNR